MQNRDQTGELLPFIDEKYNNKKQIIRHINLCVKEYSMLGAHQV